MAARTLWLTALAAALLCSVLLAPATVHAERGANAFMESLAPKDRKAFEAWLEARTFHDFQLDKFWRETSDKRAIRKRKRSAGEAITADDYVMAFPPEYKGPALPADLDKAWAEYKAQDKTREPPKPLPSVADFLANAKSVFRFEPERIPEREFKRRYAEEALTLGLNKDQVVRVFALETGGNGTADMQAGINPITKQGRPISSALGYAQLLHANSTSELVNHGGKFADRLAAMAARSAGTPERAAQLSEKREALKRMIAKAKSVPNVWDRHVAFGGTAAGLGIHAINIDGDIGPWLQVIKLKGILDTAQRAGRTNLAPAEMELMNLAGPGTGLEMMEPVARGTPTVNFFARGGYERNTIVRGKTAVELLAALEKRMEENLKRQGSIEFGEVFDEVMKRRQAGR